MDSNWKILSDAFRLGGYLTKIAEEYTPRRERREKLLAALEDYLAQEPRDGHPRQEEESDAALAA